MGIDYRVEFYGKMRHHIILKDHFRYSDPNAAVLRDILRTIGYGKLKKESIESGKKMAIELGCDERIISFFDVILERMKYKTDLVNIFVS